MPEEEEIIDDEIIDDDENQGGDDPNDDENQEGDDPNENGNEYDPDDDGGQDPPTPDDDGSGGTETGNDEQEPNTKFTANVLYENNGSVYGLEVLLYDVKDNLVEKLAVVDEDEFNGWIEFIGKLSQRYITFTDEDYESLQSIKTEYDKIGKLKDDGEKYTIADYNTFLENLETRWEQLNSERKSLETILKNEGVADGDGSDVFKSYPYIINATSLNDTPAEDFSKKGHLHSELAVRNHSSVDDSYGVGSDDRYGHLKVIDNLDASENVGGEALSAHQGNVLYKRIRELEAKNLWEAVVKKNDYLKYKVNPDLRLVVCDYHRKDYTGLKSKTGVHTLHKAGTIPEKFRPSKRVSTPLYRGDVTLYYNTDGSVNIYNLTKIKKINVSAQVIWHY